MVDKESSPRGRSQSGNRSYKRHGSRYKARRRAVDILFEAEFRDEDPVAVVEQRRRLAVDPESGIAPVAPYTAEIVLGVAENLDGVDTAIASHLSDTWTLDRLPAVDRAVLRVSSWELLHNPDIPVRVAVTEGIELASEYSTDVAPAYVNAVLDDVASDAKAARDARVAAEAEAPAETAPDAEVVAETDGEAAAKAETAPNAEVETEAGIEAAAKTETATEIVADTEPAPEAATDTATTTDTASEQPEESTQPAVDDLAAVSAEQTTESTEGTESTGSTGSTESAADKPAEVSAEQSEQPDSAENPDGEHQTVVSEDPDAPKQGSAD